MPTSFQVTDDAGFLALIDPDAYRGFVDEDWTWESIHERFLQEIKARHLLIWGTGTAHTWKVDVSIRPRKITGFREITGSIEVSQGRLLLTNYESLTMAAQFSDVTLPEAHEENQILSVPAGLYHCRIIQQSDPEGDSLGEESPHFVYELTRATSPKKVWTQIPWSSV